MMTPLESEDLFHVLLLATTGITAFVLSVLPVPSVLIPPSKILSHVQLELTLQLLVWDRVLPVRVASRAQVVQLSLPALLVSTVLPTHQVVQTVLKDTTALPQLLIPFNALPVLVLHHSKKFATHPLAGATLL